MTMKLSNITLPCPSWIWDTIKHPCSLRFQPILVPPGTPKVKTLGGASCGVCILCLAPVPWSMVGFVDGWCVFFCGGNSQFHVIVVLSLIFVDSFVILNMCILISECIDSSKIDWFMKYIYAYSNYLLHTYHVQWSKSTHLSPVLTRKEWAFFSFQESLLLWWPSLETQTKGLEFRSW